MAPPTQPTQPLPHPSSSNPKPPLPHIPSSSSDPLPQSAAAGHTGEDELRPHVGKKLQKKGHSPRALRTMELPERFRRDDDSAGEDDEEDVRAAPQGAGIFMNMNQSIFGLIAAAGSRVDFHDRFEGQSSDEEEGDGTAGALDGAAASKRRRHARGPGAQTTVLRKPSGGPDVPAQGGRHRRKMSESKLLRSLPTLSRLSTKVKAKTSSRTKESRDSKIQEGSESTPPSPPHADAPSTQAAEAEGAGARLAPVMSRMLEAKAEMAARPSFDLDRLSGDHRREDPETGGTSPSALARKLKEIFEFDHPEEVIQEYPCWLLQSVLLQGYMYITGRHICFYAYLPKKAHEVVKSGYLSKSGKRNPKYNRYWFRLKGDVLAYYRDPSNLYFPHGQIDLRYGISASITDKDREGVHFSVVTHHRTYHFRADSAPSAKEWVKSLQRVIFRSHNDGDSIKISLPIRNVIDVEEAQMVEFADTCKVRVIDNDETYAVDEYFFSFFSLGKEAINVLRILVVEDEAAHGADRDEPHVPSRLGEAEASGSPGRRPASKRSSLSGGGNRDELVAPKVRASRLQDSVKATLVPMCPSGPHSPRASGDLGRASMDASHRPFGRGGGMDVSQVIHDQPPPRRSFSESRRSPSRNRVGSDKHKSPEKHGSSDSFVPSSLENPSQASLSAMIASSSDDPSASQILRGSDVFHSPTIRRSASASRRRDTDKIRDRRHSPPAAPLFSGQPFGRHAATTGHIADPGAGETTQDGVVVPATPTLQSIAKMGSYPLQRAGAFATFLNSQSKRMSNLLATESMGYVEKVSGMWKGGRKHYDEPLGLRTDDDDDEDDDDEDDDDDDGAKVADSMDRFRSHFALPETEKLQATYFGYLMRVLPLYGKIYLSARHFCFRSLLPGTRTKLILPLRDIENVDKEKGFRFGYSGLVVVVRGHEELFFEFGQAVIRDDCAVTLLQSLETARYLRESGVLSRMEREDIESALAERDALQEARVDDEHHPGHPHPHHARTRDVTLPRDDPGLGNNDGPTILFDDPKASFLTFKPLEPLRVTCLTIGSRGDVQPYIALCKGLLAEGHRPRIATHAEFQDWIEGHGIEFARVEGDPSELMRLCIQNGTFTWAFLREANSKFRGWLDELLASAWEACQGSDLLIESPSAMAGIHIAEALQIPYFRAFTMPWTRTRAYPHAFVVPEHKMGGAYNYVTYIMFDNVFWKATAHQVNRWRNSLLGLPNTNLEKMQPNKVPFLYNFSSFVVPPPLDYSDWIRVTGYWFLDEGTAGSEKEQIEGTTAADGEVHHRRAGQEPEKDGKPQGQKKKKSKWEPPADLLAFIDKARQDEKKLVYVGFGSIIVPDPAKMTQEVIDAVLTADVRCVLSKGWSDRIGPAAAKKAADNPDATTPAEEKKRVASQGSAAAGAAGRSEEEDEPKNDKLGSPDGIELPPEIFQIKSAPHDWLFAQMDAAAHHGGSGTTGASLRAGIPTIVRPFFGDQFFFGSRVEDLGVGICLKKWGANSFAKALWEATNSDRMIVKARILGEQIRKENGVDNAIQCIYRDMEYAKSLIKAKAGKNAKQRHAAEARSTGVGASRSASEDEEDDEEDTEESWTFVGGGAGGGDESDAELAAMRMSVADLESFSMGSFSPDREKSVRGKGRALGSRVMSLGSERGVVR